MAQELSVMGLQLLPSVDTGNGRAEKNGKEHVSSIMMTSPECLYKGYKGQKRRPPPSSECLGRGRGQFLAVFGP